MTDSVDLMKQHFCKNPEFDAEGCHAATSLFEAHIYSSCERLQLRLSGC